MLLAKCIRPTTKEQKNTLVQKLSVEPSNYCTLACMLAVVGHSNTELYASRWQCCKALSKHHSLSYTLYYSVIYYISLHTNLSIGLWSYLQHATGVWLATLALSALSTCGSAATSGASNSLLSPRSFLREGDAFGPFDAPVPDSAW